MTDKRYSKIRKRRQQRNKRKENVFDVKNTIIWFVVVLLSIALIIIGNRTAMKGLTLFGESGTETVKGKVLEVLDRSTNDLALDATNPNPYTSTVITFTCAIKSGTFKGETINAQQSIDSMVAGSEAIKEVEAGDNVMLFQIDTFESEDMVWQFGDYYRFDKIVILGLVFMALVLFMGRWKGFNTLLSLSFTFLFVFLVFVPSIMNGYNPYVSTGITCVYSIISTLVLINGISKKTLATITGCISGTVIAALAAGIMNRILLLTGFVDDHSYYLTLLNPDNPIDLTSIIFAAIVIGAMGAIMDVAMDISSSLFELSENVPDMTFKKLFQSGMHIGRDIMGTMANTLVLAYIGGSLSSIMLLLTYSNSIMHLLNREVIIVDLLQALIGSSAILLTIPFTVIVCGILYIGFGKKVSKEKL